MKILLVGEQNRFRSILAGYLALMDDFEVFTEIHETLKVLSLCNTTDPEIVLIDGDSNMKKALVIAGDILALSAPPSVMILSLHTDPKMRIKAQRIGVKTCVRKDVGIDAVVQAIRNERSN